MIALLGKKIGMTRIFTEKGAAVPVTIIELGPCVVTGVRSKEKGGYNAVQLGFGVKRERLFNRPQLGFFKKIGVAPKRYLREIRTDKVAEVKVGDELRVDNFEVGDMVDVIGSSIGKGFQGVVKRHGFSGGPGGHGSKFGRESGSTGMAADPARIFKGTRMAGHMGDERVTVQNLPVVKVDLENNLLVVRGAIPGVEQGLVVVRDALKKHQDKSWKVAELTAEKLAVEEAVALETVPDERPEEAKAADKVGANSEGAETAVEDVKNEDEKPAGKAEEAPSEPPTDEKKE